MGEAIVADEVGGARREDERDEAVQMTARRGRELDEGDEAGPALPQPLGPRPRRQGVSSRFEAAICLEQRSRWEANLTCTVLDPVQFGNSKASRRDLLDWATGLYR